MRAFLLANYIHDPNETDQAMVLTNLWHHYRTWLADELHQDVSYPHYNQQEFGKSVWRTFPGIKSIRQGKQRKRLYLGLLPKPRRPPVLHDRICIRLLKRLHCTRAEVVRGPLSPNHASPPTYSFFYSLLLHRCDDYSVAAMSGRGPPYCRLQN
jgi:hypothetical protein